MRGWIAIAGVLALAGCGSVPHQIEDRSDFLAEATHSFPGETEDRVIEAAQRVLRQSDPDDVDIRNSMHGFVGLRRYMVYAVLATAIGREKWDFSVDRDDAGAGGIRASLSISEAGHVTGETTRPYEGPMNSIPLYRLFWRRVEYVLGRSNAWVSCDQAEEELKATNTNPVAALGGLCGPTSQGRNAPPPPQLDPMRPAAAKLSDRGRSVNSKRGE